MEILANEFIERKNIKGIYMYNKNIYIYAFFFQFVILLAFVT